MEQRQIIREKLLEDIARHRFKHLLPPSATPKKNAGPPPDLGDYVEIVEAPGYLINRDGVVRRASDGFRLRATLDKEGYAKVGLTPGKKKKSLRVHRLLAIAFIPNPEGRPCVNHRDGVKSNNALANLEWCTHKENFEHAKGILKVGMHRFTVDDILLNKLQHLIDCLQDIKKRDECTEALRVKIDRALQRVREM